MAKSKQDAGILDELYATILSRKGADPDSSHTARLFSRGRAKIAQKVGEEAVETVIEAVRGDRQKLAEESADLLYHLLVLWADAGLDPAEVFSILENRKGISGIEEKKSRKS
ncbi:phosphoribosyl-ATP diphosphatase [Indioceanicola profundi]|uniref:phosphoribosyl-ATP diphosphatase n=1 Tax=Indioceanicola profundi TaxID=2220096 RepID=UPI000E6AAAD4|nr:phosphoribosyl-ATP diphosphatase [Indioceanicola profundi]